MRWNTNAPLDNQHFDPETIFHAGLAQHHIANTAYPIGHTTTMRPYRVGRSSVQETAPKAWLETSKLGLYVHIPFCEARCAFCEYTVIDPSVRHAVQEDYFDLLEEEFALYNQAINTNSKTLIGFDIGGGTPSAASIHQIARVVNAARKHFIIPPTVTVSIETTPKIAALEPAKIKAYYELGIQRISMGMQTINQRLLEAVGRTGTSVRYNQVARDHIRAAGFQRFNIDVMYGFANQPLSSLQATLEHAISLEPEYITLYRTRYKGTRLVNQAVNVSLDEVNQAALLAKNILHAAGYSGTNGKNTFSRLPGDVGTSNYLTERVIHGTPYLGLGLGAQSLSETTLAYNAGAADKQLKNYLRMLRKSYLPIQDLYHLSLPVAMGKMISVSFYFGEVNLQSFETKFGVTLQEAFPDEVDFVLNRGLMEIIHQNDIDGLHKVLRLTRQGELAFNGVIALFYAGAVKNHLISLVNQTKTKNSHTPTTVLLPEAVQPEMELS